MLEKQREAKNRENSEAVATKTVDMAEYIRDKTLTSISKQYIKYHIEARRVATDTVETATDIDFDLKGAAAAAAAAALSLAGRGMLQSI